MLEGDSSVFFFFNDTATTEIYTLSLHDALPISGSTTSATAAAISATIVPPRPIEYRKRWGKTSSEARSEEHTSELQSRQYLVCRLLLEKKNYDNRHPTVKLSLTFNYHPSLMLST